MATPGDQKELLNTTDNIDTKVRHSIVVANPLSQCMSQGELEKQATQQDAFNALIQMKTIVEELLAVGYPHRLTTFSDNTHSSRDLVMNKIIRNRGVRYPRRQKLLIRKRPRNGIVRSTRFYSM